MSTDRAQAGQMRSRGAWTFVAVASLSVILCLTAASRVRAAPAGSVCPDFKVHSTVYHWSVIGTFFSCKTAKPWLAKLVGSRVRGSGSVTLHSGPRGYHCSTVLDKKHYALAGACYTGTLAYPKQGFQWFGG
jgi:hypothetical protein